MNKRDYIAVLCFEKAKKLGIWNEDCDRRLAYELEIISEKGFEDYFLIYKEIIEYARSTGILVGPGRGSAAGSLVSYLLGITKINPLKYDLYFERFLNPSRPDFPDIDSDFQSTRRQEIFDHIVEKYGEEYTCRISTYSRFHIKQTLKDLCRVFKISIKDANKLAKFIPNDVKTLEEAEKIPEVDRFFNEHPQIYQLADEIQGAIRQKSIHAAGIVITPKPVFFYLATERIGGAKGSLCSCFDMFAIDQLGLLKLDILSLRTLDVIAKALELANLTEDDLPSTFEDPRVYERFQRRETLGIFQFESNLLTGYADALQIPDFPTLYACTTIARPGPLHSGEAEKYKHRHQGKEEVSYLHPMMEPITAETYGLMLYQEQMMKTSVALAGFTQVESELLRKVIGKSKGKEAIDKYMQKFIEGCVNNGIDKNIAEQIWGIIRESSEYGFNKAHAVSYSAISYWCAWLKTYYLKEFLVALMVYETDEMQEKAVRELREHGHSVNKPDINLSNANVSIGADGAIYMGFSDIEGVGAKATEEILLHQPYGSFDDFLSKIQRKKCNIKVIRNLIQSGAFDSFGQRDELYYSVTEEPFARWDTQEMMKRQGMVLDMPSETPLIDYYENNFEQHIDITPMRDIDPANDYTELWVRGIVSNFNVRDSTSQMLVPNGKQMAFFNLDDGTNKFECFIAPEQFTLFGDLVGDTEAVVIKAHTFNGRDKLYVDGVLSLTKPEENKDTFLKYVYGRRDELLEARRTFPMNCNIVKSANYQVAKSGKPYIRVVTDEDEEWLQFRFYEEAICPGEIIVWDSNKDPFMEIEQRLK